MQGATVDLRSVLVILYLGITGTGLSQYTWSKSLSLLPASTCSLFYPLQALFSALLGALILSEQFSRASSSALRSSERMLPSTPGRAAANPPRGINA